MANYYVDVDEELAADLQRVNSDAIVEVLEELVEDRVAENSADSGIAKYDTLKELRNDESVSPEQRKRNELKWQRSSNTGGRTRHNSP